MKMQVDRNCNSREYNHRITVKLGKPRTPEIFLEYYCVAREEPTRRQETKPQAATVSSLRLGGLLACPDLPCDWLLRDKQS